MNYPSRNEVMELIHLFAASPANSKNERAFGLRDVRDCAVRLLDGEDAPEVNRNIIQDLPELGVCWVVQYDGAFGQEIAKLMEDNTYPLVDWSDTTMKTETNLSESAELIEPAVKESLTAETKEHAINKVFETALHKTAERVEPPTEEIQSDVSRWVAENIADPFHDEDMPKILVYAVILLKRLDVSHTKRLQAHGRVAFHKSEQELLAEELFESNKTNESLTRELGELHDTWMQQNTNVEINMVAVEAEGGEAYDWRGQILTRKQCADELEALLNRSEDDENE